MSDNILKSPEKLKHSAGFQAGAQDGLTAGQPAISPFFQQDNEPAGLAKLFQSSA